MSALHCSSCHCHNLARVLSGLTGLMHALNMLCTMDLTPAPVKHFSSCPCSCTQTFTACLSSLIASSSPHSHRHVIDAFCQALLLVQLTTNLIKKAEEGVNGLIAKIGAPADLSQHSPHASVQQLLHATRSLTELNAGSALGNLQVHILACLLTCHKSDAMHLPSAI